MPWFLVMLLFTSLSTQQSAQHWPSFRGPGATGLAAGADPPVSWSLESGRNVAWTRDIPGLAHSSPIVWGNRVYLTTSVALEATDERVTLGDVDAAGIDSARDTVRRRWELYALDLQTGEIAWRTVAHEGVPRLRRHVKASHASATPATNGRVIVALMGSEGLFAFDVSGKLLWRQDLGVMDVGLVGDPSYQWGPASSPIIYGDRVIVQNDRHKDSFLAAFDLATGRELWRANRDEWPSWATPAILPGPAGDELVTVSPHFIRGYDPQTGRELWRLADPDGEVKTPSPVVADGLVVITGGYPARGRPILAIRAGARGTLSPAPGDNGPLWRVDRGSPYTPTPIVRDGIVYTVSDNGVLTTYDLRTGARIAEQRIGAGAGFSASPVSAAGRLYVCSEDGDMFVLRAGRDNALLATNPMQQSCMATPAIAGSTLVVRTRSRVVALRTHRE